MTSGLIVDPATPFLAAPAARSSGYAGRMADHTPAPRLRIGDAERDEVLRVLQEAHAAGRLDIAEVDDRQDQALRAKYVDELLPVVADLPEGRRLRLSPDDAPPAPVVAGGPAQIPTRVGAPLRSSAAILSGRTIVPEQGSPGLESFAFWGGHDIYLRDCMGPGAVVTLEVSAIMAGHDIYVPPGVRVVDDCTAIMAGNDIDAAAQGDGSNGTLILRGFLFWAGHDVKLDPATLGPGTYRR